MAFRLTWVIESWETSRPTLTSTPAGITCGSTCSASFASGTSVNLTATPGAGSTFTGWSGACSGTGACTVTLSQAQNVTATFAATATAIRFVQVAAATPQKATQTVTVPYPSAQTAGNLSIIVVGWNDATSTVQSVTDSRGNTYTLAIGPTTGTGIRQSIYYAPAIVGGTTTVTVTFNQAASFPDIRILEYAGVTTLDKTAGASGNGTSANSGSVTSTAAAELLVGANTVATATRSAGSNFTSRIITKPDSDLVEDRIVSATGSYSASASLKSAGPWVMQLVTFK